MTVTGTAAPCVVFAGTFSVKVVVEGVKVTLFQLFTSCAASTDPRPVARSYPVAVREARRARHKSVPQYW